VVKFSRFKGLAVSVSTPSPASVVTPPGSASNLLDAAALDRTLRRMAQEILEHHPDASQIALIGIPSRGVELAARLGAVIGEIAHGTSAGVPLRVGGCLHAPGRSSCAAGFASRPANAVAGFI